MSIISDELAPAVAEIIADDEAFFIYGGVRYSCLKNHVTADQLEMVDAGYSPSQQLILTFEMSSVRSASFTHNTSGTIDGVSYQIVGTISKSEAFWKLNVIKPE